MLIDITKETSCNSRQLDILIRLDYFSDFGEINELTYKVAQFRKLWVNGKGFKTNIKEEKAGILVDILDNYSEEHIPRTVKEVNIEGIATAILDDNKRNSFLEICHKCQKSKKDGTPNGYNYDKLFKLTEMPEDVRLQYATKISDGEFRGVDAYKLLTELEYYGEPQSVKQKIRDQQEFLSYIDYTDPELPSSYIVVTDLNTSYSPKFVAYCLKNGKTCPMKVRKNKKGRDINVVNSFKDTPFEEGDILQLIKCKQEPKAKFVNGKWERDYTDKEWWTYEYKRVD